MANKDEYFNCYDTTKLTLSEVDSLNTWFEYMKKRYKIIAQLVTSKKDDWKQRDIYLYWFIHFKILTV